MADSNQEPKQTTPKGLELPVPSRKEVMDAFTRIVGPPLGETGYRAVMKAGRDHPSWLPRIRACYEIASEQAADPTQKEGFAATWVGLRLQKRPVSLEPLVRWGVLEPQGDVSRGGHRVYYRMPDLPGVARALQELGVLTGT